MATSYLRDRLKSGPFQFLHFVTFAVTVGTAVAAGWRKHNGGAVGQHLLQAASG